MKLSVKYQIEIEVETASAGFLSWEGLVLTALGNVDSFDCELVCREKQANNSKLNKYII